MSSRPANEELLAITTATRSHISYLQELGIETFHEAASNQPVARAVLTAASPVASSASEENTTRSSSTPAHVVAAAALFGDVFEKADDRLPNLNETFDDIRANVGNCTRCDLCDKRTNVVHTDGNRQARLMFVGEAPGADEDAQARPFVGRAGQLLTKIIEAIGMKREEVLIGNVNRCRPPGNRPPTPEEAATCKPFLLREIAITKPEVIVVMGNTALRNLLETKETIGKMRGRFHDYKGIKVMPTFHPAYLLRDPSKKKETWHDLKLVRDFLDRKA